jgi:hypothetical protein
MTFSEWWTGNKERIADLVTSMEIEQQVEFIARMAFDAGSLFHGIRVPMNMWLNDGPIIDHATGLPVEQLFPPVTDLPINDWQPEHDLPIPFVPHAMESTVEISLEDVNRAFQDATAEADEPSQAFGDE